MTAPHINIVANDASRYWFVTTPRPMITAMAASTRMRVRGDGRYSLCTTFTHFQRE